MKIELIQSKEIYRGKAFTVYQEEVKFPNAHIARLDIVKHTGAVVMIPVDKYGNIWFVNQYRHAAGKTLLELPAGTLNQNEEPTVCAQRELREEIGMEAKEISLIGEFYIAPGYSTEYLYIYLARNLSPNPLPGDIDEFITVDKIPIKKAYSMAESGLIIDAKTLAGLLLARPKIIA